MRDRLRPCQATAPLRGPTRPGSTPMRSSALDLAQGVVAQDRGTLARIEISRQVSPMRTIIAATDFSKASNQAVLKLSLIHI